MTTARFVNLDKLLDRIEIGIVIHARDSRIIYANQAAQNLLRLSKEMLLGKAADDPAWYIVDEANQVLSPERYPVSRVIANRQPIREMECGIVYPEEQTVTWVSLSAFPEFDADGELFQVVISFVDITEKKHNFSFKQIVEMANDIVVVTEAYPLDEPGPKIVYVNESFTKLTGYEKDEVIGRNPRFLQGPETDKKELERLKMSLEISSSSRTVVLNYSKTGRPYWLEMNIVPLKNWKGEVTHFAAVERDVTTTKDVEKQLKSEAMTDSLTGLLNRRGLEFSAEEVEAGAMKGQAFSVIAADLDFFKGINDQYGHAVGDQVLKGFAETLKAQVRAGDFAARVGGEEFLVLLPGTSLETACNIAERLRVQFEQVRFSGGNHNPEDVRSFSATVSLGVASCYSHDLLLQQVVEQADQALYEAKRAGRNRVEHYQTI